MIGFAFPPIFRRVDSQLILPHSSRAHNSRQTDSSRQQTAAQQHTAAEQHGAAVSGGGVSHKNNAIYFSCAVNKVHKSGGKSV
jgi:hypothetical protein